MIWIKILFLLYTCSMHIWTEMQVSNSCIKYCRRSCGDKNSTTKCDKLMEGQIGVLTDKGKTICPSPLCYISWQLPSSLIKKKTLSFSLFHQTQQRSTLNERNLLLWEIWIPRNVVSPLSLLCHKTELNAKTQKFMPPMLTPTPEK